jgi:hypothetical protein
MKIFFFTIALLISLCTNAQNNITFFELGLNYRQDPLDIEDVPRGPSLPSGQSGFYGSRFCKVLSLSSNLGVQTNNLFGFSVSAFTRYNHLYWLQGRNFNYYDIHDPEYDNRKEKKNFKYDIFLNAEKKFRLKKSKERFLFASGGIGFTNLNTKYDVMLQDTFPSGPGEKYNYKGTLLHLSPRFSLGYQFEKLKASIDAFVVEGPDLTNLTSLWLGATIRYEMKFKKRKKSGDK